MKKLLCVLLVLLVAVSVISCADREVTVTGDGTGISDTVTSDEGKDMPDSIDFTPLTDDTEADTTEPAAADTTAEITSETETEQTEPDVQTEEVTSEQQTTADTTPPAPPLNTGSYSSDPLISRMTFLGDSTTYGLKIYGIVGDSQVWTPSNGTLALFRATTDYIVDPATGGEYLIGDLCSLRKPDILVITLGVNGISFMDEGNFKSNYNSLINIIKSASPSTKIAIQTMYPLSASYDTSSGIDNYKISNGNLWIQQIAAEQGIACINSASVLVDASGFRPEAWQNGDGLHMSAEGFAVVMNYIINNPCY